MSYSVQDLHKMYICQQKVSTPAALSAPQTHPRLFAWPSLSASIWAGFPCVHTLAVESKKEKTAVSAAVRNSAAMRAKRSVSGIRSPRSSKF